MFGRLPKLQAEIHVETNLSDCVGRLKFAMCSLGYDLIGRDDLIHQFVFSGRSGQVAVPGCFGIWLYGMGQHTRLVVGIVNRLGFLPVYSSSQRHSRLAMLGDLIQSALGQPGTVEVQ